MAGTGELRFVVHKHDARRLHYDFRLEAEGALVSWAIPKGPSFDPKVKRLAVHVEDHALEYGNFEGVIPGAKYGSGTVLVWDEGTYRNLTSHDGDAVPIPDAVQAGHLSVWLDGSKLHGGWSLTRTSEGDKESWIMVKRADDHADRQLDITASAPDSARSGRSLAEVAAAGVGHDPGEAAATGEVAATGEAADPGATAAAPEPASWRAPMLAQLVKPDDHYRATLGGWQYERKLDGLRCVAVRNDNEVELWSRNHLSFNARFPEVVAALRALPAASFTLDGELVAFEGTRTSFAALQRPGGKSHAVYCVFDVIHLLGRDTTGLDLTERQALVAQVLDGSPDVVATVSGLKGDPAVLYRRACADGWEGLIAKRVSTPYQSGRSGSWQKLKCSASQELVIAGWTDPSGTRAGFGALLVGYYDDDGLRYAGKVGTGFGQQLLVELHEQLRARAVTESPFVDLARLKGAHWAKPELVANVAFSEWTTDGRLRHPSFQGLRADKPAPAVRRETPRT